MCCLDIVWDSVVEFLHVGLDFWQGVFGVWARKSKRSPYTAEQLQQIVSIAALCLSSRLQTLFSSMEAHLGGAVHAGLPPLSPASHSIHMLVQSMVQQLTLADLMAQALQQVLGGTPAVTNDAESPLRHSISRRGLAPASINNDTPCTALFAGMCAGTATASEPSCQAGCDDLTSNCGCDGNCECDTSCGCDASCGCDCGAFNAFCCGCDRV